MSMTPQADPRPGNDPLRVGSGTPRTGDDHNASLHEHIPRPKLMRIPGFRFALVLALLVLAGCGGEDNEKTANLDSRPAAPGSVVPKTQQEQYTKLLEKQKTQYKSAGYPGADKLK